MTEKKRKDIMPLIVPTTMQMQCTLHLLSNQFMVNTGIYFQAENRPIDIVGAYLSMTERM